MTIVARLFISCWFLLAAAVYAVPQACTVSDEDRGVIVIAPDDSQPPQEAGAPLLPKTSLAPQRLLVWRLAPPPAALPNLGLSPEPRSLSPPSA